MAGRFEKIQSWRDDTKLLKFTAVTILGCCVSIQHLFKQKVVHTAAYPIGSRYGIFEEIHHQN